MATLSIIKISILAMKNRTGSSLQEIIKWIITNEKVRRRIIEQYVSFICNYVFTFRPF
jgi:hypothetical protein